MVNRLKWATNELRNVIAVMLFAAGAALFAVPAIASLLIGSVMTVALLALVAVACIVAGSVCLIAIAITPGGIAEVTKAIKENQ